VLSKTELDSRTHVVIEKWVKQLIIEAETMIGIARTHVLPAALRHQQRVAEAVHATEQAGVKSPDTTAALKDSVTLVSHLRQTLAALERAVAYHHDDAFKHAQQINSEVRPLMAELRSQVDTLETHVAADLWPLPTYREMLFLK
jgi:glutamine synthetase